MIRLLLAALVLLSVQPAIAADPQPYTIDVVVGLTGIGAFAGKLAVQALTVYEGIVNKSGGIHGRPLHFEIHDDATNPITVKTSPARRTRGPHGGSQRGQDPATTKPAIIPTRGNALSHGRATSSVPYAAHAAPTATTAANAPTTGRGWSARRAAGIRDAEDLPALVYTRGFLGELAKQLRVDPMQVQKTYLRRMREELATRGKELA